MGRSEQKAKERKAAQQRSLVTPTPKQAPTPARGKDLRRGGGVRNREPFQLPAMFQTKSISTPRGGKRPAPAEPAVDNNGSNGARGENRSGVEPVNGSFRAAVEQSSGAKSEKPQKPGGRVNANGLVSYGKDLGGLNEFTRAFTGGYEVADIKSAFQSEDLPGAYQNGSNKLSYQQTPYELQQGQAPSPLNKGLANAQLGDMPTNSTYQIDEASVPGTLGRSGDVQEGTSDKADIAESVRTLRMNRNSGRGSRRDPRNRGEDADMFGGPEPSDASLVSPMYANKKRNAIRDAFFAGETSVKGAVAANAVANYGKDSNGQAVFNVGGKLVYAKDGSMAKAKNAAMEGRTQDVMQYLDMPETPDTQPDSPAASELSPSFAKETPGAQEFFKKYKDGVKDSNK